MAGWFAHLALLIWDLGWNYKQLLQHLQIPRQKKWGWLRQPAFGLFGIWVVEFSPLGMMSHQDFYSIWDKWHVFDCEECMYSTNTYRMSTVVHTMQGAYSDSRSLVNSKDNHLQIWYPKKSILPWLSYFISYLWGSFLVQAQYLRYTMKEVYIRWPSEAINQGHKRTFILWDTDYNGSVSYVQ